MRRKFICVISFFQPILRQYLFFIQFRSLFKHKINTNKVICLVILKLYNSHLTSLHRHRCWFTNLVCVVRSFLFENLFTEECNFTLRSLLSLKCLRLFMPCVVQKSTSILKSHHPSFLNFFCFFRIFLHRRNFTLQCKRCKFNQKFKGVQIKKNSLFNKYLYILLSINTIQEDHKCQMQKFKYNYD